MALTSIATNLDEALLQRMGYVDDDLQKIQASGSKLNVERIDALMVHRGLSISERIAFKGILARRGLI